MARRKEESYLRYRNYYEPKPTDEKEWFSMHSVSTQEGHLDAFADSCEMATVLP